jgi:hypothetical protein
MSSSLDLTSLLLRLRLPRDSLDFSSLSSLCSSVARLLPAGKPLSVALVAGYFVVCSAVRFRSINRLQRKMGFTDRRSLARMSGDEASVILRHMVTKEFPTMYELGLQFALFKVSVSSMFWCDMTTDTRPDIWHRVHFQAPRCHQEPRR